MPIIMAQYTQIESMGSIGAIMLGVLELQVLGALRILLFQVLGALRILL